MDKGASVFFRDVAKVYVPKGMPQNAPKHEKHVPVDLHTSNFIQKTIKYSQWTYKKERNK